jgi:hypothetical protein
MDLLAHSIAAAPTVNRSENNWAAMLINKEDSRIKRNLFAALG